MKYNNFLSQLILYTLCLTTALPLPILTNLAHADGDSIKDLDINIDDEDVETGRIPIFKSVAEKNAELNTFYVEKLGCPNFSAIFKALEQQAQKSQSGDIAAVATSTSSTDGVAAVGTAAEIAAVRSSGQTKVEVPASSNQNTAANHNESSFDTDLQKIRIESLDNYTLQQKAREISNLSTEEYYNNLLLLSQCFESVSNTDTRKMISKIFDYTYSEVLPEIERNKSLPGFQSTYGTAQLIIFAITLATGGAWVYRKLKDRFALSKVKQVLPAAEGLSSSTEEQAQRGFLKKLAEFISKPFSKGTSATAVATAEVEQAAVPALAPQLTPAARNITPPSQLALIVDEKALVEHYRTMAPELTKQRIQSDTQAISKQLDILIENEQKLISEKADVTSIQQIREKIRAFVRNNKITKRANYELRLVIEEPKTIGSASELFDTTTKYKIENNIIRDRVDISRRITEITKSDPTKLDELINMENKFLGFTDEQITNTRTGAQVLEELVEGDTPRTGQAAGLRHQNQAGGRAATTGSTNPSRFKRYASGAITLFGLGSSAYLVAQWAGYRFFGTKMDPRIILKAAQARVLIKLNNRAADIGQLSEDLVDDIKLIVDTKTAETKSEVIQADLLEAVKNVLKDPIYAELVSSHAIANIEKVEELKSDSTKLSMALLASFRAGLAAVHEEVTQFEGSTYINIVDLKRLEKDLTSAGADKQAIETYLNNIQEIEAIGLSQSPVIINLNLSKEVMGEAEDLLNKLDSQKGSQQKSSQMEKQ